VAAVDWLLGPHPRRVLDLGAGTGKLTAMLVAAGHDVVAVDPSENMLAVLRQSLPRAHTIVGSAESIPLPDADVDTVVAAQAYHWFDLGPAHREIARILRLDGVFGAVWNLLDTSVPWVAELAARLHAEDRSGDAVSEVDPGSVFGPVESASFPYTQRLDLTELLSLVRSRSYVAVLDAAAQQAVLADVTALVRRTHGDRALDLPYVTKAYRTVRRA